MEFVVVAGDNAGEAMALCVAAGCEDRHNKRERMMRFI